MKRLRWSHLILLALVLVLAYLVGSRLSVRMGGTPAGLRSDFETEEQWLLTQIVTDVAVDGDCRH